MSGSTPISNSSLHDVADLGLQRRFASTSPISRLPAELISLIFLQCVPRPLSECKDAALIFCKSTRTYLTRVCRVWMDIALSTPSLWSIIALILTKERRTLEMEVVKMWIKRARQHPLDIYIRPFSLSDSSHPVFDVLVTHVHLWRDIFLFLTSSMVSTISTSTNPFPLLEVAVVQFLDFRQTSQIVDFFTVAPRLYSMSFGGARLLCKFTLPWTQLTHYTSPNLAFSEVLDILPKLSGLLEAELHIGSQGESSLPQILSPICLPRLQTLCIVSVMPLRPLFDLLTTPALHTINIQGDYLEWQGDSSMSRAVGELVQRSACDLRSLCLCVMPTEEGLVNLLAYIPQLTELRLRAQGLACITPSVLSRLTVGGAETEMRTPCLVPNLNTLAMWRYDSLDDAAFWRMVLSRCTVNTHASSRLKHLTLYSYTGTPYLEESSRQIQECKELGLEFKEHRLSI